MTDIARTSTLPRRPRRGWRTLLIVIAFALVAGGAGAWMYRAELAAQAAIRTLEQMGLGPVALTVGFVGLHSARASDISLYGGAILASRLTMTFEPGDLYAGHADAVEIEGLRTAIAVQGNDITVGGRPLPAAAGAGPSGIPVASVTLRDVDITATLPGFANPVRITGSGRLVDDVFSFELVATMAADKGTVLEILTAGRHNLADGGGTASVIMKTLKFHKGSKQPKDLLPALTGILPPIDGEARAAGIVSWKGTTIIPDLIVHVDSVAFETSQAGISALEADLHIIQLAPLATAPHQVLTASLKPGGLPASALRLQFELQAKPAIKVEALSSEFAGGKISATAFTVDPARPSIDTILHFSAVELDRVFDLLNVEGLAGSGRIEGDVSLHMRNGKLLIDKSSLAASGPGELNITNTWLADRIGGDNQTVRDAMQALGDFHYETLTISLDRAEGGEGSITLHLQGQNPTSTSLKGQKINFNIRVESNFDRLTALALQSVATTHQLLLQR